MKYKFRTSLGPVVISFDENSFKDKNGIKLTEVFSIESGGEHLNKLYDGWLQWIQKTDEGFFAKIELSDAYYGSPEYLLEKI